MPTVLRIATRLNRGGPLRQLAGLVPALRRLGWSGPVVVGHVDRGESDGGSALAGADLRVLPALRRGLSAWRDARALRAIMALAREVAPDVIHTHMGKAGALGRWAAHRLGIPCVHTLHGHHLDAPGWRGLLAVRAERMLARRCSRLVVLSERQRRDVVDVHRVAPASRVAVVGPGLDLDVVREAGRSPPCAGGVESARASGWLGEPIPAFVWCGRLVEVKQPWLALEAAAAAGRPWRLVMVGQGVLDARLRALRDRLGLRDRVALVGEAAEAAPWIARARGLVLTSRSEGTPMVMLEAFALGRPVVAPTVGGIPDLLAHDEQGLWVPPGDPRSLALALDRLSGDEALCERLAQGARLAGPRHDSAQQACRLAALYAEVVASAPGGRRSGAAVPVPSAS